MSFGLDSLLAFHTTGTRLALFSVSRPCGTGYSARLWPLPSLDPLLSLLALKMGKRSELRLYPYSIVKVLLFFQLYHPTKGTLVH